MKKGRKFGRTRGIRRAFLKSLAEALILRERITTTLARAKETRRVVEPFITRSRSKSIASIRLLRRFLSPPAVTKLVEELGPRFANRPGGYTRVVRLKTRSSDSSPMAILEFVERQEKDRAQKTSKQEKV